MTVGGAASAVVTPLFGLTVHRRDGALIVLEKPAGVLMHRTHPRPQVSLLEMIRRELWREADRIDVVHRLDRETSGLVVLAVGKRAARNLSDQFRQRRVSKRYQAIVVGEMADDADTIDIPIGNGVNTLVRKQQVVNGENPRPAVTRFKVIDRRGGYTLVELTPRTGRLHQIRVHMAHLGHPLLGDKLYGPDPRWHLRHRAKGWTAGMAAALTFPRHALHATGLAFDHPESAERITVTAPLAADMAAFWADLS